jgi:hypothetical protein
MSSNSDLRAFLEDDLTVRFEAEQLGALVSRSLEASTMFETGTEGATLAAITAPCPAARPSPSRPDFLEKGPAVLVLPESELPRALEPVRQPSPRKALAPTPARPVIAVPIPMPIPAAAAEPRVPRKPAVRRRVERHSGVGWQLFKLSLLWLAVACQPWWWNVGDLHGPPAAAAAPK